MSELNAKQRPQPEAFRGERSIQYVMRSAFVASNLLHCTYFAKFSERSAEQRRAAATNFRRSLCAFQKEALSRACSSDGLSDQVLLLLKPSDEVDASLLAL